MHIDCVLFLALISNLCMRAGFLTHRMCFVIISYLNMVKRVMLYKLNVVFLLL